MNRRAGRCQCGALRRPVLRCERSTRRSGVGRVGTRWVVPSMRCLRIAACRHAPFAIVVHRAVTGRCFTPLDRSPVAWRLLPRSPVSSRGLRLALLSRGLRCALSPSLLKELPRRFEGAPSRFAQPFPGSRARYGQHLTLNRAPRARLARLAGEPPVRGMRA